MPAPSTEWLAAAAMAAAAGLLVVVLLARIIGGRSGRGGRGALSSVARRLDERLGIVVTRVDGMRRGERAPAELIPLLAEVLDGLEADAQAVRDAPLPPDQVAARDAFAAGIVRATRLVERILDACMALEGTTRTEGHERALRSMRWAHLNLASARASLAREAARLAERRRAPKGWRPSRI